MVGAGGGGFLLPNDARVNHFDVVTTILPPLPSVVFSVDASFVWLRRSIR